MDYLTNFAPIKMFLNALREFKGSEGAISLRAHHWRLDQNTRDSIIREEVVTPKTMNASGSATDDIEGNWDGAIEIGESIEVFGLSPKGGHIHVFNIGTSGTVLKMGPSREYPQNRIEAEVEFRIPSSECCQICGDWKVTEPCTQTTSQPERLLVILTQEDKSLHIEDLYPGLIGRDMISRCTKGTPRASLRSKPSTGRPLLFQFLPDSIEYGLIELCVQ